MAKLLPQMVATSGNFNLLQGRNRFDHASPNPCNPLIRGPKVKLRVRLGQALAPGRRHILALFPVQERQPTHPLKMMEYMLRTRNFSPALAALGLFLLAATPGALAQDAAATDVSGEDTIVAIVNGYKIRTSEVRMAFDDVIGQLPNLPVKLRYPFVVEFLVERHLLAQLATKDGLQDTDDYKRRLAAYQAKALRDTYLTKVISPKVTEAAVRQAYEEESKKLTETERIRARHILVASEKEAQTILQKLKDGGKFEDLAKQFSLDGSKDYGGDLGYFTAPEMVQEFSKAAFALKKGEISQPVKSDFGWHIIRLEDRKMGAAQPFDQVQGAIRQVLVRQEVQATLEGLKDVAKVEILDPELKKVATEAEAQRKALRAKEQKANVAAPADDNPEGGTGKGDLLLPDSGN